MRDSSPPFSDHLRWRWGYALLLLLTGTGWMFALTRPLPLDRIQEPQPTGHRIDLNAAGAAELALLPGIGPELARRMVDYRLEHGPYARVEDILRVRGIGPAKLRRIAPCLVVHPVPEPPGPGP